MTVPLFDTQWKEVGAMRQLTEGHVPSRSPDEVSAVVRAYSRDLVEAALSIDVEAAGHVLGMVRDAVLEEKRIFIAGNGGSAATANHIAQDLSTNAWRTGSQSNITALSSNDAAITAIGNDETFGRVFATQIEWAGRRGDLLILISVSGDSENLVQAARTAVARGMAVVALLGREGVLVSQCDAFVVVGGADYGLAEDLHTALGHALVRILHGGTAQCCSPSPHALRETVHGS